MTILHHALRFLLAAVFLVAGSIKLTDMPGFAANVGDFGLVPDVVVAHTAWAITLLELVVGVGLAVNHSKSLPAAIVLLGCFVGVLLYGIWLGLDIHCGCFGAGFRVSLQMQLFIDLGLILICGVVLWSGKRTGVQRTSGEIGDEKTTGPAT